MSMKAMKFTLSKIDVKDVFDVKDVHKEQDVHVLDTVP
jgi:hypothetical protein